MRKRSGRSSPKLPDIEVNPPQDRQRRTDDEIAQLREEVFRIRAETQWSFEAIRQTLLARDPPVDISVFTISRYIAEEFKIKGSQALTREQAKNEVVLLLEQNRASYRRVARIALSDRDSKTRLAAEALLNKINADRFEMLERTGRIDRTTAKMFDGEQIVDERRPNGEELRRMFEGVEISELEIVSDAERAIRYGDHAAALPPASGLDPESNGRGDGA